MLMCAPAKAIVQVVLVLTLSQGSIMVLYKQLEFILILKKLLTWHVFLEIDIAITLMRIMYKHFTWGYRVAQSAAAGLLWILQA